MTKRETSLTSKLSSSRSVVVRGKETKLTAEYCGAMTQAAGRSCCNRSGTSVFEFGFQTDFRLYTSTYIVDSTYTEFRCEQNSTYAGPSPNVTIASVGECV